METMSWELAAVIPLLSLNNTHHAVATYFSFMYFGQMKHSTVEEGEAKKLGLGVLEGL